MKTRRGQLRPEPVTAAGEVLLSHNHIALLHGLYDRPGGRVGSRAEWVRAARPFAERMKDRWDVWGLRGAMITMRPQWVKQEREGSRIASTLTNRGRAIVERTVAARIRGRGPYLGLHSVDAAAMAALETSVPDSDIREAVAYAKTFGLPLLMRSVPRSGGIIFAVSEGLGKPFQLKCYEELHSRGPQAWHWEWTRQMIENGQVPSGYLSHFAGYDEDDVLEHLQEIQDSDDEQSLYLRVYNGVPLASRSRIHRFLQREVDFTVSDFDPEMMVKWARAESPTYQRAADALDGRLSWTNPDTGASVGTVYRRGSAMSEGELVVTTPEALSCLQRHWDNTNVGLAIETRYIHADAVHR